MQEYISLKGVKENNLKNINIDISKNKLVVLQKFQVQEKQVLLSILYSKKPLLRDLFHNL